MSARALVTHSLVLLLAPLVPLLGQSGAAIDLLRLTHPIRLDGTPAAEEWSGVPALPLTLSMPTFRGTPKQRTEIRVAYATTTCTPPAGSTMTCGAR